MTYYSSGSDGKNISYFATGSNSSSGSGARPPRPFVEFSPRQDRASLMTSLSSPLSRKSNSSVRRRRRRVGRRVGGRRRKTRSTRIRVIKGRVALRVGGFPGVQRLGASQLVRFVPLNKLRAAARRVLGGVGGGSGGGKARTRRRKRRQHPAKSGGGGGAARNKRRRRRQ